MRNILTVARKEIRSSFVTPLAYVVIAGFVIISGFFFFSLLQHYNSVLLKAAMIPDLSPTLNEWVIFPFYQTLEIVLVFLVPVLTMRSVAEERQRGTFELLATSPVSAAEIVWGKFLGSAVVVFVMLGFSFIFPLFLVFFSAPEVQPIFIGFLGILLFALSFTALGIVVSTFTRSQAVSGVVSIVFLLLFFVIDAPSAKVGGITGSVLQYLSPSGRAEALLKGVIDGRDVLYFLSVSAVGLFIANRALSTERWR